jgi:pimeloyl-ACP methyl ester carboxylesterase
VRTWWLVLAGVLVLAGAALLLTAGDGTQRESARAGETPVRILRPDGAPRVPAVVLAHGFSGSAAMMDPLGSELARAGYLVVLPDLPGHGGNAAPLVDGALEPAVGDAVDLAAELTGLPVAVVGHSMGAGAVTSWAVDSEAEATVAISLPSAEDLPADPARPANLLLLWGSAEQQRFVDAALAALRLGYPQAEPGPTYGSAGDGTARRAAPIAGAEHIAVIYRAQTAREVSDWLAPGDPDVGEPTGDLRWVGLLLVLVGGLLAARPLVAGVPGAGPVAGVSPAAATPPAPSRPTPSQPTPSQPTPSQPTPSQPTPPRAAPVPRTLGWLVAAMVVAGVGARLLQPVAERVPVAVVGYLMGWFAFGSLVLVLAAARRRAPAGSLIGLARGALAGGVLAVCLALPARVTWAAFLPVGPRWGVALAALVVLMAWFWGEARLIVGTAGWRRVVLLTASRALVVLGLLGAVGLLGAPGFLTLTVPLVIPLLALLAVVAGWARDPAAAAPAQAIPLALAIATTFPILG